MKLTRIERCSELSNISEIREGEKDAPRQNIARTRSLRGRVLARLTSSVFESRVFERLTRAGKESEKRNKAIKSFTALSAIYRRN